MPETLRQAVQHAVDANPDVQTRWHRFLSAGHEQDFVRAGYKPTVDLTIAAGRAFEKLDEAPRNDYNRYGAAITLTQMLYDGFFTRHEVSRFGHARMVRYYELLRDAEEVALEAVRAYVDVTRYRELVEYAKENYVEHKLVHEQIMERTRSGVGRGVDLELATGRLALAESNLLTEVANLHDVSARYLRVMGVQPPKVLDSVNVQALMGVLPTGVSEALSTAHAQHPALKAAVADIRASQDRVESRKSAYHPRLDLRVRQELDRAFGDDGPRNREGSVELVFNYNLYRGGGDQARLRQAAEELNVSKDVREKVCRDIRQTLSIALNDLRALGSQLQHLNQHQLSMDKARQAYRQQFDIGQRSLLDLLDGENEYFEARRAYANAIANQQLAQFRSLAGMGQLLSAVGVVRDALPQEGALADRAAYTEPDALCPPLVPELAEIDKEALLAEAMRSMGHARP